jgi:hypothetical protein
VLITIQVPNAATACTGKLGFTGIQPHRLVYLVSAAFYVTSAVNTEPAKLKMSASSFAEEKASQYLLT